MIKTDLHWLKQKSLLFSHEESGVRQLLMLAQLLSVSESAYQSFWPFPHQLKTLLPLQAMSFLHLRQEEGMAGRQFPDISVSVSGKANIFLEILWQTSACVSLAITDHWPSLALLSGRWQERWLAKTVESVSQQALRNGFDMLWFRGKQ